MILGRRKTDSISIRLIAPVFVMFLGYLIYEGHSTVVKDFTIEHTIQTEDSLVMYGKFEKLRNCKFDSMFVTTPADDPYKNRRLLFEFTDVKNQPVENIATRQKGTQHYGPWTVFIDSEVTTLNMRTLHQCNFGIFVSTDIVKNFPVNLEQDF